MKVFEMENISYSSLQIILFAFVTLGTLFGTFYYRQFALKRGIIAKISFRSLHQRTVSRGGGIVFASAFFFALLIAWRLDQLPTWLMLSFGLGGMIAALLGYIDDVHEIPATKKLIAQFCLATWLFITSYKPLHLPYLKDFDLAYFLLTASTFPLVSVWFINLYNFIDGIDGMAIGGSIFICISTIIILTMTGGDKNLIFIFSLLAVSSIGFSFFNLPPASVFMGDAGSIFLGYCLGGLLLVTILSKQIGIWTWITLLGYFIGDTTMTGAYRVFFVKKWYGVHRSHAYQNLARILNNHAKVTYGVAFYNILWSLPLAIVSVLFPQSGPITAIFSLGPVMLWTYRFGPRLSSE